MWNTFAVTVSRKLDENVVARTCAVLRQSLEQGGVDPRQFIASDSEKVEIEQFLNWMYTEFGNGVPIPD